MLIIFGPCGWSPAATPNISVLDVEVEAMDILGSGLDAFGAGFGVEFELGLSELSRVLILGGFDGELPSGMGRNWGLLAKLVLFCGLGRPGSCKELAPERCDIAERGLVGLACPSLNGGTASELLYDGSYPSSSESEDRDRTLFCRRSRSVRLRSVLLDALDVLVWRLEMLAESAGTEVRLNGLRAAFKHMSAGCCWLTGFEFCIRDSGLDWSGGTKSVRGEISV